MKLLNIGQISQLGGYCSRELIGSQMKIFNLAKISKFGWNGPAKGIVHNGEIGQKGQVPGFRGNRSVYTGTENG